jgi:vacuolar-type H+-ATPase subunit E/Vma4
MDKLSKQLRDLRADEPRYLEIFTRLLRQGVETIGQGKLVASICNDDLSRFHDNWDDIVKKSCGTGVSVKLTREACRCSGGVRLVSEQDDVMLDNTFEGIIGRREDDLHRLIFERLFSTMATKGGLFDG